MNADAVVQGCLASSLEQRHQVTESVTLIIIQGLTFRVKAM